MEERPTTARIDAAIIITYATALAYFGAFEFESHYLAYFGLPAFLAEVDLRALLLSAGGVMLIGALVYFGSGLVYPLWPNHLPGPVQARLRAYAVMLLMAIFVLVLPGAPLIGWIIVLAFPIGYLLIDFILPIWAFPKLPTYWEKVEAAIVREPIEAKGQRVLHNFVGAQKMLALFAFVWAYTIVGGLGTFFARTTTVFLINSEGPVCVVIRSYTHGLICIKYDAESHSLRPSYRFVEPNKAILTLQMLGRLGQIEATAPAISSEPSSVGQHSDKSRTGNASRASISSSAPAISSATPSR